ncbi:MAG: hypothetical protein KIT83_08345 [Bryobacterales bacterium]|nr:hypothetical protein [Bryobacterales bacterium]
MPEPRFQVSWGLETAQVFGVDVEAWQPGETMEVDETAIGHPHPSLAALRPGKYYVQAVLNVYETLRLKDGRVLKLPWDNGEGQHWNRSPGNLFSEAQEVTITADTSVLLELSKVIAPLPQLEDTQWIRRVQFQSKILSEFWGRPVPIGAIVLVPPGFDDQPLQRYPVVYIQGHFPTGFNSFRDEPPPPDASAGMRQAMLARNRFAADWKAGRLPKMLLVLTQHPTPFYDDSYGINSANNGPWGDAMMQEFYPWLETRFRGFNEPWARIVTGGSTGGWMSLAQQVFYPDFFGGVWSFCPDPLDFHAFQLVNVYEDKNAHYDEGPFQRIPKLLGRLGNGSVLSTNESFTRQELVLGTRGRSGGQLDAFHSVFGPIGADGYPAKLWDPLTGVIDASVAKYWTENYDLTAILKANWEVLGPKLIGKIHVTMGTKDTFFLEGGVHRMESFLESTKEPLKGPYYGGKIVYGDNKPHCYVGDIPEGSTMEQYYLPIWAEHIRKSAPSGADTASWMP